jgi:hypothetical protein
MSNSTPQNPERHEQIEVPVPTASVASPPAARCPGRRKKPSYQAAKSERPMVQEGQGQAALLRSDRRRGRHRAALAQAARDKWLADKDYLLAGREPPRPEDREAPTLEVLVNKFLTTKQRLVDAGELSPWTMQSYDGDRPVLDVSRSPFPRAKPSRFSARPAAARPRSCAVSTV